MAPRSSSCALVAYSLSALLAACSKRAVAPPDSREPERENTVTTPRPIARESASAPAPVATSERWDTACENDGDCVPVSASECCPAPCASTVVNKRDHARAAAALSEQCIKERQGRCPSAGACRGHAYLCVESQCRLVFEGDPDYRPRRAAR
jgi:hypothetical protein